MKTILRLGFILFVGGLFACQKHKDSPGDQLSMIMVVDSTHPTKGMSVYEFVYDGRNRVTAINIYTAENVGQAVPVTLFNTFINNNPKSLA